MEAALRASHVLYVVALSGWQKQQLMWQAMFLFKEFVRGR